MLSRVADSIYWMSRYIERAENVARFVDVNHHLMLDLPAGVPRQWEPLVITAGGAEDFAARYREPSQENVIQFLTFDSENPNSILSSLRAARENARSVREIIPAIMWEELNEFCLYVEAEAAKTENRDFSYDFFRHVKRAGHLLEGVTNATLSRGEAWHFSRTGRLLERADKTTRIVDVKYFMLLLHAVAIPGGGGKPDRRPALDRRAAVSKRFCHVPPAARYGAVRSNGRVFDSRPGVPQIGP